MPLPAALLARLQKRGIVKVDNFKDPEEEVIAEDYDDVNKTQQVAEDGNAEDEDKENCAVGCPNKWNIYHTCSSYCRQRWGMGKAHPSPTMERKVHKLLRKYPLPDGWHPVYDPGTAHYYFWNVRNDQVSWLPPGHPKAKVSECAEKLRALIREDEGMEVEQDANEDEEEEDDEEGDSNSGESERDDDDQEASYHDRRRDHGRSRGRRDYERSSRRRGGDKDKELDPMDPAAYSDAPRGTWSSGLERKGEAKTGADTTASGPLYQMRPYPSPGAVLRMNAELKSGKDVKK